MKAIIEIECFSTELMLQYIDTIRDETKNQLATKTDGRIFFGYHPCYKVWITEVERLDRVECKFSIGDRVYSGFFEAWGTVTSLPFRSLEVSFDRGDKWTYAIEDGMAVVVVGSPLKDLSFVEYKLTKE